MNVHNSRAVEKMALASYSNVHGLQENGIQRYHVGERRHHLSSRCFLSAYQVPGMQATRREAVPVLL